MMEPAAAEAFETSIAEEEEIVSHLGADDVEACTPRIPANVDFDKMEPRTNYFNLQGIIKSITENPLKFGAVDRLVNLKAKSFNTEKYD